MGPSGATAAGVPILNGTKGGGTPSDFGENCTPYSIHGDGTECLLPGHILVIS